MSLMNEVLEEIADNDKSTLSGGKIIDQRLKQIRKDHLIDAQQSLVTTLKEFFKKNTKVYEAIIYLVSPICPNKKPLRDYIKKHRNKRVINIGAGNTRIYHDVINLDIFNYDNVDIVTDAKDMCLKDNSVDGIISIANLEHIDDPEKTIKEIHRVLKQGGECFLSVPFIYGFHASPNDFTRWTHEGIKVVLTRSGFDIVRVGIATGPTSAILTIGIEYLSILLSFGIKKLYEIWQILFTLVLWPFKFLDLILIKIPFAINIASNIYIIARKK